MSKAKVRPFVFTDEVHSSGCRILLVLIALGVIGFYAYSEALDVLQNWDNDEYFSWDSK